MLESSKIRVSADCAECAESTESEAFADAEALVVSFGTPIRDIMDGWVWVHLLLVLAFVWIFSCTNGI